MQLKASRKSTSLLLSALNLPTVSVCSREITCFLKWANFYALLFKISAFSLLMNFNKTSTILIFRKERVHVFKYFPWKLQNGHGGRVKCFSLCHQLYKFTFKGALLRKVCRLWKKPLLFEIKQMLLFVGGFSFVHLILGHCDAPLELALLLTTSMGSSLAVLFLYYKAHCFRLLHLH